MGRREIRFSLAHAAIGVHLRLLGHQLVFAQLLLQHGNLSASRAALRFGLHQSRARGFLSIAHLRIIEKTGLNQIRLRFMQPQTFGIAAFIPGDKVEFVNHATLRAYASNTVTALERVTDKDWLLTLAKPVADFGKDDVVDNISWYPNLTIRNCTVDTDSCRGFLITTRGKALVEGCTFIRTRMSAILCEDDAEGWFESGRLRDLTIRNNKFINCGIEINPHTSSSKPEEWVHENIRIENNFFNAAGISAHNVKGLTIVGNRSPGGSIPSSIAPSCTEVKMENNAQKANE